MPKLLPYIYSEDARKQAAFYAQALGGEIVDVKTFADAPGMDEKEKDRVMHLVLKIGGETIFMADNGRAAVSRGNGMDLTLIYENESEARAAFTGLSKDGKVIMPFERMFWGTSFGRLEDRFGIRWQISTES